MSYQGKYTGAKIDELLNKVDGIDVAVIEQQISNKQDKIEDLEAIRQGAKKGATALQEIPEEYAKKSDVAAAIEEAITVALNTEV